MAEFTCRR